MHTAALSLEPGLYVTATPIGNLGDITYRAVAALRAADLILCEDTRQTAKLCAAYEIKTRRAPYHDHNAARVRPGIIEKLQAGAAICLVSDAGTPLISDPGYKLVREARDAGVKIIPLPGASAAITALSAAGAPSDRFLFAGFLPAKAGAREKALGELSAVNATLIFYETAPRLAASLEALAKGLGDRTAIIARELTKKFEEMREGPLSKLAKFYHDNHVKGEIVVLVFPPQAQTASQQTLDAFLAAALKTQSLKEAAASAVTMLGVSRNEAYQRALKIRDADHK